MRISDWSSDVCSSDLKQLGLQRGCLGLENRQTARRRPEQQDRAARCNTPPAAPQRAAPPAPRRRYALHHRRASDVHRHAHHRQVFPTNYATSNGKTSAAGIHLWLAWLPQRKRHPRSEEHTSELQSLMRISYAVFCLKKKTKNKDRKE